MDSQHTPRRAVALAAIGLALVLPLTGCQTPTGAGRTPAAAIVPSPTPGATPVPSRDDERPTPCIAYLLHHDVSHDAARAMCSIRHFRIFQ